MEIRKTGYVPRLLRLRADTAFQLMVPLDPNPLGDAVSLPAVVTTERRQIEQDAGTRGGFLDRCQLRGVAHCVGRAALDKRPLAGLDQVIGNRDGVVQEEINRHFPPASIEGIEVYLPTDRRPARFQTDVFTDCGAIVIWTRGRPKR